MKPQSKTKRPRPEVANKVTGLDLLKVMSPEWKRSAAFAAELMVPVFALTAKLKSLQGQKLVERNQLGEWRLSAEGQIARNAGKPITFGSMSGHQPPAPVKDDSNTPIIVSQRGTTSRWEHGHEVFKLVDGREFVRASAYQKATLLVRPRTRGIPLLRLRPYVPPARRPVAH